MGTWMNFGWRNEPAYLRIAGLRCVELDRR